MQTINASPTWQYLQPDAVFYIFGLESIKFNETLSASYKNFYYLCT